MTHTPGEHLQEGRGTLVNMFAEQIVTDARKAQENKNVWRRVPGSTLWGTGAPFEVGALEPSRNLFYAGGKLYHPHGNGIHNFGINGSGIAYSGALPGAPTKVIWAKNNKPSADIIAVVPGEGPFTVTASSVAPYSGFGGMPIANSVCFLSGFFIFSIGDGRMYSTDVNVMTINSLNYAAAETKPDTLLRVVPIGNGMLLACGDTSMEVWGPPINSAAFPFSYIAALPYGLLGRNAITGYDDGWTQGLFFVAQDYGVYMMRNLQPIKISPPDLDRLIKQVMFKDEIEMSVFSQGGRGIVVVQTSRWCWCFNINTQKWHTRKSYLQEYWRHIQPVFAWSVWLAGDRKSSHVYVIDPDIETEAGDPLVANMSGLIDTFPEKTRISAININCTHGTGITTGKVPIQTDPALHISYSVDGGVTFSDPAVRRFGQMGNSIGQATVRNCGIVRQKGYHVRCTVSDPVYFGILGGNVVAV